MAEEARPPIAVTAIARALRLTRAETLSTLKVSGIPILRMGARLVISYEHFAVFMGGRPAELHEPVDSEAVSDSRNE